MKILIVSQYFTPDITAAAFRIGETSAILESKGHDVQIITTYPHKSDVEIQKEENNIHRVHVSELEDGGVKGYLKHYLSFIPGSLKAARELKHSKWRPDIIWVSSPPLFTGISGWFIKKMFRVPFVFDVRDIWPDTAVAAGQLSAGGKAYKIGRFLERFLYKRADYLTCVSAPMQKYLKEQAPKKEVEIIYNAVSDNEIGLDISKRPADNINKRVLIYAGNLGYLQGLHILIEAYNILRNETDLAENWEIHFYGGGAEEEKLKKLVHKYNLNTKIIFKGVVSKIEVQDKLQEADLLFLSLMPHPVLEKTIPSKLFDYLITGKPIIGGISGEGKNILESVNSNITFEAGDVHSLVSKLKIIFSDVEERLEDAFNNIKLVKNSFTREKMTDKLEKYFEQIINNK